MDAGTYCERCGRRASPDAAFCGACGRSLDARAPQPEAGAAPRPGAGGQEPARGLPPGGTPPERALFDLRPLSVQGFGEFVLCLLTLGLAWLLLWLRRLQVRYLVTTQRIEIRRGLFDRRRETIELFRVQDFEIEEPLFLRLRAAGNLVVRTLEAEQAVVTLRAVPQVQEVYETLRSQTIEERNRHRVRLLEGM